MKLLAVSHFYESHGGGIERVASQLCRQFVLQGHDVFWAASDADPLPDGPITAIPLRCANPTEARTGLPMPVPGPKAIRDLIQAIGSSDAVIIHDALYVTSILAMFLAKLRAKPVVLIQHIAGIEFANPFLRALMWVANHLVTRPMLYAASVRFFISDEVRRKLLGKKSRNTVVLFNGVDNSIFRLDSDLDRHAVRQEFGIARDAVTAIFVGRFVAKKGMSVLEALARNRTDVNFVFVGNGPIRPNGWALPNVVVLGSKSQQTLARIYAAADLLLLPSVGEGYPLVIQEAMACGVPVICGEESARADPNATRWLRGVKIDLADPNGSASRCSAAVDEMLVNPPDPPEMASYAAKTYNWALMADSIVQSLSPLFKVGHSAARRFQPG